MTNSSVIQNPKLYGQYIHDIQQCVLKTCFDCKIQPTKFYGLSKSTPDPCYDTTNDGFMLEIYDGPPNGLHTPFGYYSIIGQVIHTGNLTSDMIITSLRANGLELELIEIGVRQRQCYTGLYYIIISVNGVVLPKYKAVTQDPLLATDEEKSKLRELWKVAKHPNSESKMSEWAKLFSSRSIY